MFYRYYHNNLDSKIWNDTNHLKEKVKQTLLAIAWNYINYLRESTGIAFSNDDVKDIFVYGSIVNYTYDESSDIDVCVVINFPNVNKSLRTLISMLTRNWKMLHVCHIYERTVDVSTAFLTDSNDGKTGFRSGGTYSLFTDSWVVENYKISKTEFTEIYIQAKTIYKKLLHAYKDMKHNSIDVNDFVAMYTKIIKTKSSAHQHNMLQPITPIYLAFRMLRNKGIMDDLKDQIVKLQSAPLSLK